MGPFARKYGKRTGSEARAFTQPVDPKIRTLHFSQCSFQTACF